MIQANEVDRKTASRLLKVSIRTVDRYIRAKKLSTRNVEGRIWLNKNEILRLKKVKTVDRVDIGVDRVDTEKSIDNLVSGHVDMSIDGVDIVSTRAERSEAQSMSEACRANTFSRLLKTGKERDYENIYKKLFEEQKEELRIKQERLEGANYRVGQLEALLKETVPLPEHQKLLSSETAARLELEEGIELLREKLQKTKTILSEEKTIKKIYVVILFIIMALQPLWLIFSNAK